MAAITSWRRCGTKLHHCHPVYSIINSLQPNKKLICNVEAVVSAAAPRCITDARVAILIQFRIVFYSANE